MKISVLGAGAWGTALAASAAARHSVTLWARDAAQARSMAEARENARYLPGIALPAMLAVVGGPVAAAIEGAELVVLAAPMAALREQLLSLGHAECPVAWLCKGVEPAPPGSKISGLLPHEVQAEAAPHLLAAALSGPSFAMEVAQARPTALVAASPHAGVRDALVAAFHGPTLRVYANEDIVGVEVGGAVKNVLAIATGLADGLSLGLNARAALVTRGLAEMTRFGVALGARPDTFMGLSGLGDLVLTATGDLSRSRKVGLLLAQGQTLQQAVQSLGHVAEGVYCARTLVSRARQLGVEMPISESVVALLDGRIRPEEVVSQLMGREPGVEAP
ncbi:MAG: NAD(P)-dependent glycerol-3-phosphate dehydrogenase [Gammaproteobacteria bacterium]|nr:NAD(P)-dependent glycerol-3-phosphate dehydrogenase [Gammaproteobacteria bacterium]